MHYGKSKKVIVPFFYTGTLSGAYFYAKIELNKKEDNGQFIGGLQKNFIL